MQKISEYQLCPKCLGEGRLNNNGITTSIYKVCDVCNGNKTLIKPLIELTLTESQKEKLAKVYGALWVESNYDPINESVRDFAKPLTKIMQELNEELKFKA